MRHLSNSTAPHVKSRGTPIRSGRENGYCAAAQKLKRSGGEVGNGGNANSSEKLMRFLHTSDLHYRKSDAKDIEIVLRAFEESLAAQAAVSPIDLAFFTGDLVYSGDDPSDFDAAGAMVTGAIARATSIPPSSIILCPGNHDLSRKAFNANDLIDLALKAKLTSASATNSFIDESFKNPTYLDLSLEPLRNYLSYEPQHYREMPLS
jgi:predicted MPP superfamily phosphohydrolase